MTGARSTYFVTCGRGLEPLLHAECKELAFAKLERQVGGVRFEGTLADAWRANLWLRTAIRVLLRLVRFEALDGDQLYVRAGEVDWTQWFTPGSTFVVDAQTNQSALDHSQFVAQRVKDAIVDQLRAKTGERPSVDKEAPDVVVHVHLFKDRCTLSVDTSGSSLHKRGWRRFQGRAPLAETTAAAIVLLSGWDRRAPLVDPFCGSGTLLVEAALLASRHAPGLFRESFGFERFPGHDAAAWHRMRDAARELSSFPKKLKLVGVERDAATLAGARENLAAAGLTEHVELVEGRADDYEFKRGWNAWIVTNPPYGERVGDPRDVERTLRAFGARLAERCSGYGIAMLGDDRKLFEFARLPKGEEHAVDNGGIECRLRVARLA
ncbi:MAG: THUMP domain-containing protein [Planctomycetes bacterium]|nr:THUMP domain-containing protein [Planctomycetota bacterium]